MSTDPDTPGEPTAWPRQRPDDDDGRDEHSPNSRVTLFVVALTILLIGGGIWLAHTLTDMRKLQDCVLSGRTNCAPIDVR